MQRVDTASPPLVSTFELPDRIASLDALPEKMGAHLIRLRRHLHQHPELGFKEQNTSALIRTILEQAGLDVQGPIARTGLFVDIEGHRPGPTVAYRADIDALPQHDAKTVPYASTHAGVAHLCGHDAHTTVALGVALTLSRHRDFGGTVRVFFQPNEEGTPSGAPRMIRDGAIEGVESVYAIHVDPSLDVGRYGLLDGPASASADRFTVTLRAPSSGHSARPHEAVDTLWVTSQIMNHLYQLVGRISDARLPAVLTACWIRAGEAFNVIPQEASFGGTLRCLDAEVRRQLHVQIRQAAEQMAEMHGAEAAVLIDNGVPPVDNDPRLNVNVAATLERLFGPKSVYLPPLPSMGGEDFAYYQQKIPGTLVRVGTGSSPATRHPLHDAKFDIDESALLPTVQLMSSVLVRHLQDNPLV